MIKVYLDGEYQGEYDTLRQAADAHHTHVSLAYATMQRRAMMTKKGYAFCNDENPFTEEELKRMKEKAARRNESKQPKEPKRNWQTKTIEGVGVFETSRHYNNVFQLPRKKSEKIEAIKSLFNVFQRKNKIDKMRYAYLEELLEAL